MGSVFFNRCSLSSALASCGCCTKSPQTEGLTTTEMYSLTVLKARAMKSRTGLRSRCGQDRVHHDSSRWEAVLLPFLASETAFLGARPLCPSSQPAESCLALIITLSSFIFNIFTYLLLTLLALHCRARAFFSYSESGLLSSCSGQASHCGGFSYCRARTLGHAGIRAAPPGLQGSDSVVVAHGLNCLATGGIFADQGWNASLLHRKVYS